MKRSALLTGLFLLALLGCRTSLALALGACCPPPCYECLLLTEEECLALDGSWSGEGTGCDPAP